MLLSDIILYLKIHQNFKIDQNVICGVGREAQR